MNRRLTKRMLVMLILIGVLFAAIVGYRMFVNSMMQKFLAGNALPPATVTAMPVGKQMWRERLTAVGTLRAMQGVDVASEVAGIVEKVHFKSGQLVEAGELLIELQADEEQAQLQALQASRRLAGINHERNRQQFAIKAVSQAQLDASAAELARLKAEEARQEAIIDKKRIVAPFAGRLGVSRINVGQFLNPAEPVVTLQDSRFLYVDFNLPQKHLGELAAGRSIAVTSDAMGGKTRSGRITAINATVDPATRNVAVEGMLDNADGKLLPGMFVQVAVETGAPQSLLTLPQTALSFNPYGTTLFVAREKRPEGQPEAEPQLLAEQVFVKTGPRRGDQIAIVEGIGEGDLVVTSGQMKLKNGTPLIINNAVVPANEAAPEPQEH